MDNGAVDFPMKLHMTALICQYGRTLLACSYHNLYGCKIEMSSWKGNVYTKKCRDSGKNNDLRTGYQVLRSCKSCLKYALQYGISHNNHDWVI